MTKALVVVLAAPTAVGTFVATVFALFIATFCDENCTPTDDRQVVAFVAPGVVTFVCACLVVVGLALDLGQLVLAAYGAQVIAAVILLGRGLGLSEHSDGKLFAFALAVELPAAAAVAISRAGDRSPRSQ